MTSSLNWPPLLVVATFGAAALGCATSFRAARLTQPATASRGPLTVSAERVPVSDAVVAGGVGHETAVAVELTVANAGPQPALVGAASLSFLMALDPRRPQDTLSLTPAGGGEGAFPGGIAVEEPLLGTVSVPPGQARRYWALFRGYRFAGSDVPRRIALVLSGTDGRPLELVLADPARGALRWEVDPVRSGWMLGFQNASLYSQHLTATVVGTQVTRVSRAGPILWDVGIASKLVVQTRGALMSQTSSFAGFGLGAHVAVPVVTWGAPPDPRALAVYAGAEGQLLAEIQGQRASGDTTPPHVYGGLGTEVGLELDIGVLQPRATPFPLSPVGRGLPRWSLRAGYTRWWVGQGASDGFTNGVRVAW